MTPEAWTVLVVGIGIAGMVLRMDTHVRDHGERLARVEGLLEGLLSAVSGRNGETP